MCVDDPYDYDDAYTQSQTNQSDNDDRQVTNFTVIDQGINFLENYPYYSCYLLVLCRLLDAIVKLEDESIAICTPDLLGKLFTVISQIFEIPDFIILTDPCIFNIINSENDDTFTFIYI